MNITPDLNVGEVVKMNFRTASLFQEHNIDFCCGGNKPIGEACREAGVDEKQLITGLESVLSQNDPDSVYINQLPLDELSDYIVKRHHAYVNQQIPALEKNLEKICQKHGPNHAELYEIREIFLASAGDLTMHMQKEEIVLFPYIRKMAVAHANGTALPAPPFGSVANPIQMMMSEHENEGQRFDKIAALSDGYKIPADACTTYQVTLNQLKDFENDLHRHIHLENNILFPKAIALEQGGAQA